jgi:Putative Ig domain
MQRLKGLAGRRRAGFAAAVVMAGGLAGSVLLTPGTALATTGPVTTVTNIAVTQQADPSGGTTLDVWTSASATSGTVAPSGTVDVKIFGGKSCVATLVAQSGGSLTAAGNCYLTGLPNGTYGVSGSYAGGPGVTGSSSSTDWITIGSSSCGCNVLHWVNDSPSQSAYQGEDYSYTFQATGGGAPKYALVGAPSWLSINSWTGQVSGVVPQWWQYDNFHYSVTATNSSKSISAGPFWVTVGSHGYQNGQISTSLSCPAWVTSGHKGTCTLSVTNDDSYSWNQASATGVTAQITLPASLRADYCDNNGTWSGNGQPYPWAPWSTAWNACSLSGNVVTADLGTLSPGQTETLSVTFTAHLSSSGWYRWHRLRVTVNGSAQATTNNWGWNGQSSSSSAHINIYPRGW